MVGTSFDLNSSLEMDIEERTPPPPPSPGDTAAACLCGPDAESGEGTSDTASQEVEALSPPAESVLAPGQVEQDAAPSLHSRPQERKRMPQRYEDDALN